MKKLTIYSLVLIGLFCWLSPAYAHNQVVIIPLGGSNGSSIIGSWLPNNGVSNNSVTVVTFIDDTYYIIAEDSGMEFGTYTWNASTGVLLATDVILDTNGEGGLSNPQGITYVFVNGDTLTIQDDADPEPVPLTRITP